VDLTNLENRSLVDHQDRGWVEAKGPALRDITNQGVGARHLREPRKATQCDAGYCVHPTALRVPQDGPDQAATGAAAPPSLKRSGHGLQPGGCGGSEGLQASGSSGCPVAPAHGAGSKRPRHSAGGDGARGLGLPSPSRGPSAGSRGVVEDAEEDDPQLLREYAPDVARCMLRREGHFMPAPGFMALQPELSMKMRAILSDWLGEVHRKYRLRRETYFLAMSLVDRYLSRAAHVPRRRFQLVGVTALLIAAKFEEIRPPSLADLSYVTDRSCSVEDILATEVTMLAALGYEVAGPTAAHFLRLLEAAPACPPAPGAAPAAWHLLELGLSAGALQPPSRAAAAALLAGRRLAGAEPVWSPTLARLSGYEEEALVACEAELRGLPRGAAAQEGGQGGL